MAKKLGRGATAIPTRKGKGGGATAPRKADAATVARASVGAGEKPAPSPQTDTNGRRSATRYTGHQPLRGRPDDEMRPAYPTYDSKLEADYASYLWGLVFAGDIRAFSYHPWTFLLPGGVRYTPDFVVWVSEPFVSLVKVEIHEIKGSLKMKNARDTLTRLRIAQGLFPWIHMRVIDRYRRHWRQVG